MGEICFCIRTEKRKRLLWGHDAFKYFYLRPMNHGEPSDPPVYGYYYAARNVPGSGLSLAGRLATGQRALNAERGVGATTEGSTRKRQLLFCDASLKRKGFYAMDHSTNEVKEHFWYSGPSDQLICIAVFYILQRSRDSGVSTRR